mmetsp:Transcript_29437/g.62491  ORF Transcript_29437/g.62491 Transcript_29437/m.62491 type:complete len:148 (-) Transcript_29437:202-645(-)|eukprot:CAMPEP_0172310520 /NCGR_PEP_ID=MMETSP1058-20130122/11530_1 /TAXON_ID=83371 /ORGANISM="Detonula confervacea, Strain CCMP 353" /LENGTH=147 /DNA_ID=CAMNT_0013023335 /DNA_START=130 /DNA_END=573 /DNA_ORIENTATION=-
MRFDTLKFSLLLAVAAVTPSNAFVPSHNAIASSPSALCANNNGEEKQWTLDETVKEGEASPNNMDKFNIPNPITGLVDMFSNLDDVIDDFFNKRMGNGEVFYGKRKYKPSGKVSTEYNGGGLTDWRKIEAAREFRELRAAMKQDAKE